MLGAMDSRKNPSAKKVQLNAEKFATELGNSLESLFLKHYLLKDKSWASRDDITDFLNLMH